MKKLTTMFLSMLMVITVTACGGVSEDADQYIAYSVSMMGINLEPREVSDEEILLALDEKGKAEFTLEGTSYNCKWETEGENFTLSQGKDEFSGTMIDDLITIENILDSGMDITFLKEGAEPPVDTESSAELSNAFVAPGYGAEATVPVEKLSVPSEWYGMINISDYQGPYADNMDGEHEAWGTLSHDDTGCYFQIYVDDIYSDSSVILSYYADVYEYTFYPIVHASSWIFDINITEDDEMLYTPTLTNGILSASYDYVDDDESFTFTYALAMIEGTGLGN